MAAAVLCTAVPAQVCVMLEGWFQIRKLIELFSKPLNS